MQTFRFSQHYSDIKAACEWLANLGVRLAQGRIERYLKDCRIISEHEAAGTMGEMLKEHNYSELMNSVIEAREIVGIWKGLHSLGDPTIAAELKEVPWGQTRLWEEPSTGNQARNDAFHLYFKSLLARAGFNILRHHTCDVMFEDGGTEFLVECKRAYSEKRVDDLVRGAKNQLRRHYEEDASRRGFIALSATRIPCPGTWEIHARSREDMEAQTAAGINGFYERHAGIVDKIKEPQTLGVIVYMLIPAYLGGKFILSDTLLLDAFAPAEADRAKALFSKLNSVLA